MSGNIPPDVPDSLSYDESEGVFRTSCEPGEAISTTVLMAVSDLSDRDVGELPTLNDVVDPDALDAIFSRKDSGDRREGGVLEFNIAEYRVTVYSDYEIVLRPE